MPILELMAASVRPLSSGRSGAGLSRSRPFVKLSRSSEFRHRHYIPGRRLGFDPAEVGSPPRIRLGHPQFFKSIRLAH